VRLDIGVERPPVRRSKPQMRRPAFRPRAGRGSAAVERLSRVRFVTGQRERRHTACMNILDVIRIERDRLASPFNRLVIILQPEIDPRLAALEMGEQRIVRARTKAQQRRLRPRRGQNLIRHLEAAWPAVGKRISSLRSNRYRLSVF
jgi:hypothetical protein